MSATNLIHHATIMVTNLEKADEFYGGVLSLPKIPRPDFPSQGIWYEIDGIQVHLILSEEAEAPSPRHLAFVVDDLQATLRKVAQMELPIWDDIQLEGYVRKPFP